MSYSKLYLASKKNDAQRYPYVEVEVPVPEKKQKYTRFQHEKRAKRTPGVKRVQSPHIMVTKWDVELAKKRIAKIERLRAREDKYGSWKENRTTCCLEDDINENNNDIQREKLRVAALERRGIYQRSAFSELSDLLFPVYSLANKDSWPIWAWESYNEMKEIEEEVRRDPSQFEWEEEISANEWTKEMWRRADANEHALTGNGLRENDL